MLHMGQFRIQQITQVFLNLLCHGYYLDENEKLVPDITSSELPVDFPLPRICQKCAMDTVCAY